MFCLIFNSDILPNKNFILFNKSNDELLNKNHNVNNDKLLGKKTLSENNIEENVNNKNLD